MADPIFRRRVRLPASAEQAFAWHARPGAFERLAPPWEQVRLVSADGGLQPGARVELALRQGPLTLRWVAVHGELRPGRLFTDRQESGPFALWEHAHRFEPDGAGCWLEDEVRWRLPLAPLSTALAGATVRRRLEAMFRYRHDTTLADLRAAAGTRPLRVAVTGATGLVGSALVPFLRTQGHEVVRLLRDPRAAGPGDAIWDPARGALDPAVLEGLDAVVHLAGENIAAGRWNDARRAAIRDSRTVPTALLARTLAGLSRKPRVLVAASAIGLYGDDGGQVLTERTPRGEGFLPDTCAAWEAACAPARAAGIRTVNLRIGLVLDPRGGALARMLPAFRLGLAGRLSHGRAWWSWIGIDDLLGAIAHALRSETLAGPVNAVAPGALTNAEFTRVLARVLRRPALLPAPACALRAALGELADGLLLASLRVRPQALERDGYAFRHPQLEDALRHLLGRQRPEPQPAGAAPRAAAGVA